jgi:hypothetical protein
MNAMSGTEQWGGLSALMIVFGQQPGALPQAGMDAGLWPSTRRARDIQQPPLAEQRRIVAELDAEAMQMEAVRALLPRFEAKIQRVLDRVWGNGAEATA